jgi:hypothetical protein
MGRMKGQFPRRFSNGIRRLKKWICGKGEGRREKGEGSRENGEGRRRTGGMRTDSRGCGVYQEPVHGGIGRDDLHVLMENVKSVGAKSIADGPVIWREDGEWGMGVWGGKYDSIRREDPCSPPSTDHQAPLTIHPSED